MTARLPKPNLRRGRATPHFVQRVPASLRPRVDGMAVLVPVGGERVRVLLSKDRPMVRLSLRTTIPHEIKVRQAEVSAYFATLWASLEHAQPVRLTQRQCAALAGEAFRGWAAEQTKYVTSRQWAENKPGAKSWPVDDPFEEPWEWRVPLQRAEESGDPADLEPMLGPLVDHALRDRGIALVDPQTRTILLRETLRALREAWGTREAETSGDWRPSEAAQRFPEWQAPQEVPKPVPKAGAVPLLGLVDRWWAEAKAAGRSLSTFESYRATVQRLGDFLGHDDARAITKDDVVRFKDHRIAEGRSLKTVKDNDLAGLRAIFGFAVGNGLLAASPAEGIKVLRPKQTRTRAKGFEPEEAAAILSKALAHVPAANEKPQMTAAKRWVPWLCAYTGARVGELVQLRKEDVREVGGLWTITITPEAGTVKDSELRTVVLHPHLVEQGFPQFAGGSKPGPLFLTAKAGSSFEDIRGKWRAAKNRLAEFAREVVPDERVAPNHAWRHLFKTRGREAGVADSVLDAICGHAPGTVGGAYGDVSLAAQASAMGRMPQFRV